MKNIPDTQRLYMERVHKVYKRLDYIPQGLSEEEREEFIDNVFKANNIYRQKK